MEAINVPPQDVVESTEQPKNVSSWLDQSIVAAVNSNISRGADPRGDRAMGYNVYYSDNEEGVQIADIMETTSAGQDMNSMRLPQLAPQQPDEPFNIFHADLANYPTIIDNPPPVRTYSFQESTFARRLHRACAETAYHLLLDPRRRPAEYERIFRLSLLGRDRAKITAQLKSVLDRGPHEDLDFWEAPHIHVGGAGTHYARRDPYGNLMPKKTSYNVGRVGPQTLATLEQAARRNFAMDMTVELAGFEGEWFDPYDVQGYLEEKGIFIDPSSSFAEAQIIEWPKTITSNHSNSGGPSSSSSTDGANVTPSPASNSGLTVPGKSTPLTTSQVNIMINEADVDFSKWDDSANLELTNVGYSDAQFGSWMNFLQPGESIRHFNEEQAAWEGFDFDMNAANAGVPEMAGQTAASVAVASSPAPSPVKRRSVLIDVSKLVKGESTSLGEVF